MNLEQVKANPFLLDRLDHNGRQQYFSKGYKGKNVIVCVIGEGTTNHTELTGKLLNVTIDNTGHDTSTASIIAGENIGIAPECKIISYKREDNYLYSIVNGLKFARNWRGSNGEKVNIVNLSAGSSSEYGGLYDEIKNCFNAGILVVCSSGNTGINDIRFPACYGETLTVGAVDNKMNWASWASWGQMLDVVQYAEKIVTASHTNATDYLLKDGTSFSTPIVTGLCALYYSKYYDTFKQYPSPIEAKRFIMMNSFDLGVPKEDDYYGVGFATLTGRIHKKLELQINSDQMKVNGYSQTIPQTPIISASGSTLIPLRAPMEASGFKVEWINEGQKIILTN